MKIIENIVFDQKINERLRHKYLHKLRKNKQIKNIYIIIIRKKGHNLLEMVSSQEVYRLDKLETVYVIGMANSKEQGIAIIRDLVDQIYRKYHDINKALLVKELQTDE